MRMEYSPPHFRLAVWVSLAALALLALAAGRSMLAA
jgi:hypothetical protein